MKLASEYANKAVSLDNYLAAGHGSLGMAKMSDGDSTEAEKQFRIAADLDPKSAIPHRNLGLLYDKTGKGDGSVVHLLAHKPANLLTGVSKNLPDGYVYGYIRNGGIWMPSYADAMSSDERWQVVLYMRWLEQKNGESEATTK